jgi:hypothetical protein
MILTPGALLKFDFLAKGSTGFSELNFSSGFFLSEWTYRDGACITGCKT